MNSMTGFGKAESQIGPWLFSFEVRSVNHRFLDVRFRLPSGMGSLEAKFGEIVRKYCARGSLDVSLRQKLSVTTTSQNVGTGTQFVVDWSAAESFLEQVQAFNQKFATHFQPTLESLIQSGKIFQIADQGPTTEGLAEPLGKLLAEAMEKLCAMRAAEGKKLQAVLIAELDALQQMRERAAALAAQQTASIRDRLTTRLNQLQMAAPADPQRLELEVALIAERSDISEELDRLNSHLEGYRKLLASKTPSGRPLEFLTQELHREVNTLASKSALLELTQISVDGRARIEKLREQIQNVE